MNQIDNIMALADEYARRPLCVRQDGVIEPREALRAAIEQALSARVPDGWKLVPVEQLYAWRQRINTLAILSSKANRYEAAIALKQSIRDAIDSPEAPQPAKRKPLTDEQLWANDEIMALNADLGWHMDTIKMFARAIERAHGIGEQE